MEQCASFKDDASEVLASLDDDDRCLHRNFSYRKLGQMNGILSWQSCSAPFDNHKAPAQSFVVSKSGCPEMTKSMGLMREQNKPERLTATPLNSSLGDRWEDIARRPRTAAPATPATAAVNQDPVQSYYKHFADDDPSISMRAYRKQSTVDDAGNSSITFDEIDEDDDPYQRKFRMSGDLEARIRVLMTMVTRSYESPKIQNSLDLSVTTRQQTNLTRHRTEVMNQELNGKLIADSTVPLTVSQYSSFQRQSTCTSSGLAQQVLNPESDELLVSDSSPKQLNKQSTWYRCSPNNLIGPHYNRQTFRSDCKTNYLCLGSGDVTLLKSILSYSKTRRLSFFDGERTTRPATAALLSRPRNNRKLPDVGNGPDQKTQRSRPQSKHRPYIQKSSDVSHVTDITRSSNAAPVERSPIDSVGYIGCKARGRHLKTRCRSGRVDESVPHQNNRLITTDRLS